MPRIAPVTDIEINPDIQSAFDEHSRNYHARITNMKRTLAHSLPVFHVYMQWYPLYEKVKKIVGERQAYLYSYAISTASNCPLCSVFFRRIIIEAGEKPGDLVLSEYETRLLNFGSAIAQFKGHISDTVYNELAAYHNNEQMVILIAFAGQMIATNIFNNVVETETDDYLNPYIPLKQSL